MNHRSAIRFALFGIGFLSISTQIYLIREFISVFYGNELAFGIILANWMLLTGLGAWLGRYFVRVKGKVTFTTFLLVLLSVLPTLMLVKLDLFKIMVFPYGSMVSPWGLTYTSFLVQLPFCLVNGYLFSALSILGAGEEDPSFFARAYSVESLGSLAAGLLVNFICLWFFTSFQSLLLVTALFLSLVLVFAFYSHKRSRFILVLVVSSFLLIILLRFDPEPVIQRLLYQNQRILAGRESPYGKVVVTENAGQLSYYENGMLLFSSGDVINNEERVHFAMVQHPGPEKILLISGGISGAIGEILKYNPSRIDYVELNPSLIEMSEKFIRRIHDPRIHVHVTDARRFIRTSKERYDIVLVNLPEPSTLQLNRFYTLEFFRELKQKMNDNAVVSLGLPTSSDYVSEQAGKLNSSLYLTLNRVFKHILIVPVEKNYFLASDAPLDPDIPGRILDKQIPTSYVNSYYFDTEQLLQRAEYILKNLSPGARVNHDFRPATYFYQMNYWLSYYGNRLWIFAVLFLVVVMVVLFTLNPVSTGLFSGGFTAASMEIMILFSFQVLYGYLYQAVGVIILLFMLGLVLGSGLKKRMHSRDRLRLYITVQLILACSSVLIPLVIIWLSSLAFPAWIIQLKLAGITLFIAFLVGFEYNLASTVKPMNWFQNVTGNYSAELFGSAVGAFAVTIFLFPLIGMVYTGLVLAVLNTTSAAILFIRRKKILYL